MPGNPLNITLPVVGSTIGPTYATRVTDALQALIDDIEAKITPDEIDINDDLDMSSSGQFYGLVNLDRAAFNAQVAVLAAGNPTTVYTVGNELYFQDGAGNNVPITSGGSVAGAAGNITTTGTPAYASSGVQLQWSGGDLEYRFIDDGTEGYADLVFHDLEFRNGANTLTMSTLVTTDYDIIWPATGPSAAGILQTDASGNISFSNTIPSLVTFSAGLTAAANQDITVSGTGEYKHGQLTKFVHVTDGMPAQHSSNFVAIDGSTFTADFTNTLGRWIFPINLKEGDRIVSVTVYMDGADASAKNLDLRKGTNVSTSSNTLVDNQSSTSSADTTMTITLGGGGVTIAAGEVFYAVFRPGASGDKILGLEVVYDRP
jgi:hypothetical protein